MCYPRIFHLTTLLLCLAASYLSVYLYHVVFAIDIITGNFGASRIRGKQRNNIPDACLVMSTTLIDPAQQEGATGPPTTTELPDSSSYKVYRPPEVPGSTSSKRQYSLSPATRVAPLMGS